MSFNHENLHVYQRALRFAETACSHAADWDSKHAIQDHLPRAATSVLENIAMASAAYSTMKIRSLDYELGSALECAACLDLAGIKRLLNESLAVSEKEQLSQLFRMLVGLRRAWSTNEVKEDRAGYGKAQKKEGPVGEDDEDRDKARDKDCDKVRDKGRDKARDKGGDKDWKEVRDGHMGVLFKHEELDVYVAALEVARMFSSSASVQSIPVPVFRRLDVLMTSMVLNIAEGNGRFSIADQKRFLATSHEAAIKLAARLDLCVAQGELPAGEVGEIKVPLSRVAAMTSAMVTRIGGEKGGDKARDKAGDKARDKARDKVGEKVGDKASDKARDKVGEKVGDKARDKVGGEG